MRLYVDEPCGIGVDAGGGLWVRRRTDRSWRQVGPWRLAGPWLDLARGLLDELRSGDRL